MRWKDEPVRVALRPAAALGIEVPEAAVPLVVLHRAARDAAWEHVGASRVECGGLLVGEPFAHDGGGVAAIRIRLAVPSDEDTADAISLRMEAAVWSRARSLMRENEHVVGWFHSHPGIGAFFSATDRRTQAAFFAQPFSLGWVIDPFRGEDAWFVGADAHDVVKSRVLVLEEDAR
jgi:proteasome lid subunit RPN8/RPN11